MRRVRLLVPTLAALLAALVVVQTTDLVVCADEARPEAVGSASGAASGAPDSAPGGGHDGGHDHESGPFADCLCHVAFASTAVVPTVAAGPQRAVRFAEVVALPPEVEPSGLDHVPLG